MIKSIEKLFNQALAEFTAENKHATIIVPDPLQRDFVEKFAELIVFDAIAKIESVGFKSSNDIPFEITDLFVSQIKQHFGVK